MRFKTILTAALAASLLASCRGEEPIVGSTGTEVGGCDSGDIKGFYLLNQGNMGSNKASLDYYGYAEGMYWRNIYPERNPGVVNELGDVGNDLEIYGDRLYAVINCSNLVEVMDAATARHIAAISIPNCRSIAFDGGYAYVTSYAGPVHLDPNARLGYVAKIDLATLQVTDTCTVGYQPEGMAISGGKLYVANSGGYRPGNYDNTVSVIDLAGFTLAGSISVADNLCNVLADADGRVWVSSRGDNFSEASSTYVIDPSAGDAVSCIDGLPNSAMALCGDSLYVCSSQWSYDTRKYEVSYAVVDVRTQTVLTRNFIAGGVEKRIVRPYGIAVNPVTREVFVADAGDYITPGTLYCFAPDGSLKWTVTTGDIPAHIAFLRR